MAGIIIDIDLDIVFWLLIAVSVGPFVWRWVKTRKNQQGGRMQQSFAVIGAPLVSPPFPQQYRAKSRGVSLPSPEDRGIDQIVEEELQVAEAGLVTRPKSSAYTTNKPSTPEGEKN